MPRNNGEDILSHRIAIYISYGTFGKSENNAYLKKQLSNGLASGFGTGR
jgi:hypothetical protein